MQLLALVRDTGGVIPEGPKEQAKRSGAAIGEFIREQRSRQNSALHDCSSNRISIALGGLPTVPRTGSPIRRHGRAARGGSRIAYPIRCTNP